MAYNTKPIKTDKDGNPISQYYNPEIDEYEPVQGAGGGNAVILYNEDGTPNNSLSLGEILDKLDQLKGTVIDEETRKQNEQIRQQNEQQRIDLYNALKDLDVSQYELRLQKLEHDTSVEETVVEETYGPVIPLPENAVNGQVGDVRIKGNTYTNLLGEDGDFSKGVGSWYSASSTISVENNKLKNVANGNTNWGACRYKTNIIAQEGKIYFIRLKVKVTNSLSSAIRIQVTDESFVGGIIKEIKSPAENHVYDVYVKGTITANLTGNLCLNIVHFYPNANTAKDKVMYIQDVMLVDLDQTGDADLTEEELVEKYPFINGTKSTFGAIRLKSVNEDETKESTLYVLGKDEEGNILELRSLPNGTKDEVNISERKLIKRIEVKSNITSGTIINFTDMAEGGTYYAWNDNGETETGTKGDTLGIDATTLIYQLAEPIKMPVEVFGNLQSYENGTVYIDTIVSKVNFYDGQEGITVTVPIKAIDTLYKVDKETGYLHPLNIYQAVIAEDGLSFTHPELADGDLVDWDYVPDVESTNPAISMKLPTNLKASVTSTLQGVQELSSETKNLNTRVIANRRDIEWNKIKLGILEDEFNEHIENKDNPHNITPDQIGALKQEDFNIHVSENSGKHITESGENENGRYIKFDDGTIICYMTKPINYQTEVQDISFVYPAAIKSYAWRRQANKNVSFSISSTTAYEGPGLETAVDNPLITGFNVTHREDGTGCTVRIAYDRESIATREVDLMVTVIGRWK